MNIESALVYVITNYYKEEHDKQVDIIITEEKTFIINEEYNSNN